MSMMTVRFSTAAMLIGAAILPSKIWAQQPLSPYSDFSTLTASQLAGTQVRFTMVGGEMGRPYPSLAFTTTGSSFDLSGFNAYHRHGFPYDADADAKASFGVSTSQIKAMVDSVATLPGVTDGGVDSAGYLSFGLYSTISGQPHCFESIVNGQNGTALFTKVLNALTANPVATSAIAHQACALGLFQQGTPQIVDGQVLVSVLGFRRQRGTRNFIGRVRLKNTSGSVIPVPVAVALEPKGNVKVQGPTGYTCAIAPGGMPYVRFALGSPLNPGQSTDVIVRVSNPDLERISMNHIRAFVDSGSK